MNRKGFNGKAIYNPQGKAGEYSQWACNFFTGCSNDCEYCYCKRGFMSHVWSDKPTLKKCFKDEYDALYIFEFELRKNLKALRESSLFFTFTSDPFINDPAVSSLHTAAMLLAMENGVRVQALTKRSEFAYSPTYQPLFERHTDMMAFGFTLTGHDELEPHASTNQERIKAMKALHERGFRTFASIEPVVDFDSSMKMIQDTIGFCDLYKVGLMSGKGMKYDRWECLSFVDHVHTLLWSDNNDAKVYWKESVRKVLGNDLVLAQKPIAVSADYDIFGRADV